MVQDQILQQILDKLSESLESVYGDKLKSIILYGSVARGDDTPESFYMLPNEKELSKYRLERAREDLHTAEINLSNGLYKGAVNRSYYAIFHAIRAVNILDGFLEELANAREWNSV